MASFLPPKVVITAKAVKRLGAALAACPPAARLEGVHAGNEPSRRANGWRATQMRRVLRRMG